MVERQCSKAFEEAERRIKDDKDRVYEQGHHATKEPLNLSLVQKFSQGMPWVPVKECKERPNNGRLTFVTLLKEDQEPRMRQIFKELKDTNGLSKHVGRTAWMMEMQGALKASDSVEVKRQKEKPKKLCTRTVA